MERIKIPRDMIKENMKLAMFTSVILSARKYNIWLSMEDLEKFVHYKRRTIFKLKKKFKEVIGEIDFTKQTYTYIHPQVVFNILNKYEFITYLGIMYFYNNRLKKACVSLNKLSKLTKLSKSNLIFGLKLLHKQDIVRINIENGHTVYRINLSKIKANEVKK